MNSMQKELNSKIELLNSKGELNFKGYAKKMNFIYNRDKVKYFPLKLKEWNFYQFISSKYVIQLTIGHVSYMCSVTATLINLENGDKKEVNVMKPFFIPKLELDPENNSFSEFKEKDFYMSFEVKDDKRILYFKGKNKKYQNVEIKLDVDNDPNNEKMVIATPFNKSTQFYLNYKENYYKANGYARFDDLVVDFTNSTGLVDWGRGVWPYKHEWFWGNLTSNINGVPFGFNIGWGFGNLENATENMFFYNKKAYKIGELKVSRDVNDYMKSWILKDDEDSIYLEFTPLYDNYTENKYVVIDTHCNQVYGYFKGYIKVDNQKIEFENLLAFIEHAVNKW